MLCSKTFHKKFVLVISAKSILKKSYNVNSQNHTIISRMEKTINGSSETQRTSARSDHQEQQWVLIF